MALLRTLHRTTYLPTCIEYGAEGAGCKRERGGSRAPCQTSVLWHWEGPAWPTLGHRAQLYRAEAGGRPEASAHTTQETSHRRWV